jgi:hypothetical protein
MMEVGHFSLLLPLFVSREAKSPIRHRFCSCRKEEGRPHPHPTNCSTLYRRTQSLDRRATCCRRLGQRVRTNGFP